VSMSATEKETYSMADALLLGTSPFHRRLRSAPFSLIWPTNPSPSTSSTSSGGTGCIFLHPLIWSAPLWNVTC